MRQAFGYWSDPSTAYEHNPFVRFFARLGYLPFILYWVVYAAAAFFIVARVPRRFAPIALFTFILPHYFGVTSWWVYSYVIASCAARMGVTRQQFYQRVPESDLRDVVRKAVDRFQPRNKSITLYASWWLRHLVHRRELETGRLR